MAGVLCFSETGYCVDRNRRISHLGLPPAVEYILTTTNQLRCLAVGINGNYFVSGVNKKGQVFYECELSSYPGLLSWINSKKNAFQGGNAGSFHCSLALEGDYYANFGQTLQNCQLSTAITREIKARTPTAKSYSGNPAHIALGVQYSYVMVGNKGDFCWDLKGHYGNLEAVLKDAEYAIRTITLSPFNGVFFYVLFVDGTEHFSAGELGWDLRRVA